MKCPKCGEQKEFAIRQHRAPVVKGTHPTLLRTVIYTCSTCDWVLGVESDPEEKEARLKKLEQAFKELQAAVEITNKKIKIGADLRNEQRKKAQ